MLTNAIRQNVIPNVQRLKIAAPILSAFVSDKKICIVGGIYRLKTRQVQLLG